MAYGGFWVRLMAHNIDLLLLLPLYYLVGIFIESDRLLIWLCLDLTLAYEIIFTISKWQGTPGKKYMHLKVVDDYNEKLTLSRAIVRTFMKGFGILTLFIGYAMILFHPRRKGLHDRIAGTTVIFEKG